MDMKKTLLRVYIAVKANLRGYGIGRFGLVINAQKFLIKHLKSDFAIVQGHKMFLDPKDSLNLSIYGVYESSETELVRKEIKEGDVVLDIGANIGYYTLIFAKLVGDKGRVFAFEPGQENFALLKKNVEINGYKNVTLVQKAVSNETGKLKLYLCEDNRADHRIYDFQDGGRFEDIESIRLDEYFKNYDGKINFIKMDIQGAEVVAVQGMYNLLSKNKKVKILSEFWPNGLKRFGVEPVEYLKLFLKAGFRLYEINKHKKKLESVDITELLETYTFGNDHQTNLLCVRGKLNRKLFEGL